MKKTYALLLAALMGGMSACYGPFHLTRKIWKWNEGVGSKWGEEGVFLVMTVIPVYEVALLGDSLIFNSLQFWTGNNPVAKNTRSVREGDEQAVMNFEPAKNRLRIDAFEKGRHQSTVIIEPSGEGMVAKDAHGAVLMSAKTVDGRVVVADPSGKVVNQSERLR